MVGTHTILSRSKSGVASVRTSQRVSLSDEISAEMVTCPEGHGLDEHSAPTTVDGCQCDRCRVGVAPGEKLHGCRDCNYDLCGQCFQLMCLASCTATPASMTATPSPRVSVARSRSPRGMRPDLRRRGMHRRRMPRGEAPASTTPTSSPWASSPRASTPVGPLLLRQEPQSRPVSTTHARTEIQAVFEHIAQLNLWQSKQTLSGPGSSAEATTSLRKWLGFRFEQYNIKRVVDVCGDANWQHLIPGIENIDYCGIDISPTVLRKARVRHDDKPSMSFKELDIVTDELPRADCFLLKDVLQHLPL